MKPPLRLSDLVPGLVIAGGRRTIAELEVKEFAARCGFVHEEAGRPAALSGRKSRTANRWLICVIAEQMALAASGTSSCSAAAVYVERLSWPNTVHAGDELELKIEVLDKHMSPSGASAFVRWRWILATTKGKQALELILATILEESLQGGRSGGGAAPMAYKVSRAAAMLGISRYVLYEAIRLQELRAYQPSTRSDFMILAEDLRNWVTGHQVHPNGSG